MDRGSISRSALEKLGHGMVLSTNIVAWMVEKLLFGTI